MSHKNKALAKNHQAKKENEVLEPKLTIKRQLFSSLQDHSSYLDKNSKNSTLTSSFQNNTIDLQDIVVNSNPTLDDQDLTQIATLLDQELQVVKVLSKPSKQNILSYGDFCNQINSKDLSALLLLAAYDSFLRTCAIDPTSGSGMAVSLEDVFLKMEQALACNDRVCLDRLSRIIFNSIKALDHILSDPHENLVREHVMQHVSKLKEVDLKTIAWLSSRPGLRLEQKLGAGAKILAPIRRWTLNTIENRVLKKYILDLIDALDCKSLAIGQFDDLLNYYGQLEKDNPNDIKLEDLKEVDELYLINDLNRFLNNPDHSEIGFLDRIYTNNLLMQDRYYHKIWEGFLWMRDLDEVIATDYKNVDFFVVQDLFWKFATILKNSNKVSFVQVPCIFNIKEFSNIPYYGDFFTQLSPDSEQQIPKYLLFGFFIDDKQNQNNSQSVYHCKDFSLPLTPLLSDKAQDNMLYVEEKKEIKNINLYEFQNFHNLSNTLKEEPKSSFIILKIVDNTLIINTSFNELQVSYSVDSGIKIISKDNKSFASCAYLGAQCQMMALQALTNYYIAQSKLTLNQTKKIAQKDFICIDFTTINPKYYNSISNQEESLGLLQIGQVWNIDNKYVEDSIDIKNFILKHDVNGTFIEDPKYPIFSIYDVLYNNSDDLSDFIKDQYTDFFIKNLCSLFDSERLIYILPDSLNDFYLKHIRHALNRFYSGAYPLPRSIACVLDFLSSSNNLIFKPQKDNRIVFITYSINGNTLTLTPIIAKYDEKIDATVKLSQGYRLERHASICLDLGVKLKDHNIDSIECLNDFAPLDIFELKNKFRVISKQTANSNYFEFKTLSEQLFNKIKQRLNVLNISQNDIETLFNKYNKTKESLQKFLLPADIEPFSFITNSTSFKHERTSYKSTRGANTFAQIQKKLDQDSIWEDFLPELYMRASINGNILDVPLVKDKAVLPRFGSILEFDCEGTFTLPPTPVLGFYHFPLIMKGSVFASDDEQVDITDGQMLRYEAVVKPKDPFIKPQECILKIKYEYGLEQPFKLVFKSKEKAFSDINVEWKPSNSIPRLSPVPEYLQPRPLDTNLKAIHVYKFYRMVCYFLSAFDFYLDDFSLYCLSQTTLQELSKIWVSTNFSESCDNISLGEKNAFVYIDKDRLPSYVLQENKKIYPLFIDGAQFIARENDWAYKNNAGVLDYTKALHKENIDSFDIFHYVLLKHHKYKKIAKHNLSLDSSYFVANFIHTKNVWPRLYTNPNNENGERNIYKGIFSYIFNNGRKLDHLPDFEKEVMRTIVTHISKFLSLDHVHIHKDTRLGILRALPFAGDYTPDYFWEKFEEDLNSTGNNTTNYYDKIINLILKEKRIPTKTEKGTIIGIRIPKYEDIPYALGSLNRQIQKDVFYAIVKILNNINIKNITNLINNSTVKKLTLLSKTLWATEESIQHLTQSDIENLSEKIRDILKVVCEYINEQKNLIVEEDLNNLIFYSCEIILGLLRTRGIKDPKISSILDSNKKVCYELSQYIEYISTQIGSKLKQIKSGIKVNVKKPDSRQNVPNILYAVQMYLTGDDGSGDITIALDDDESLLDLD